MRQLVVVLMLALMPLTATAGQWQEGTHFQRLSSSVGTDNRDKIEVAEVFWYGCPACYQMQPLIEPWEEQLADDVVLVHIPAMLRQDWQPHGQAFYTAQSLGVLDDVHAELFNALARDRRPLNSQSAMAEFFVEHGVNEEEFNKAWTSFSVSSMMQRGNARVRGAQVTGTPSLIVNGKYLITVRGAGSHDNMLAIADYLIEKEREAD